jgi:putative oxidoreductase
MLSRLLSSQSERAYAVMRAGLGAMFCFHGLQKFGVLSSHTPEVGSQLWFGGLIEIIAGAALFVGWSTVCAAFIASGTMAVAYVQFHWKFQGGTGLLPAVNKGELALVYCLVFLYIACRRPGSWSVDRRRKRG